MTVLPMVRVDRFPSGSRARATPGEIEERRDAALRLRFAGMSETAIGRKLGVSAATISRDLGSIHRGWRDRFGSKFDVVHELPEAATLFKFLEEVAVTEIVTLDAQRERTTAAKMKCVWAARAMRLARLNLLAAAGLMNAAQGSPRLPSAADIQEAIRAAQIDVEEDERTWLSASHDATV